MKHTRNDDPSRPFYSNIVDKKKRRTEKPASRGQGRDGDRAGRPGASRPGSEPRSDETAPRPSATRPSSQRPDADRPRAAPVRHPFDAPPSGDPVFGQLSPETRALLEDFHSLVQQSLPLDSKKLQGLPQAVRELSHTLTDERSSRRVGYLNEPSVISAYIRYYMWWNLVRLTRLFASLPLELADGDAAVDLGSGPLTVPIALWMARPDLRDKKLLWYCVDISQGVLSAGEELFLSLAAKTGHEPWQIIRIKGEFGVSVKRKVQFVSSANMFNELFWDLTDPIESVAKKHARELVTYAAESARILVIEPGVPVCGRFVSLLRDSLMRLGFQALSPCPHDGPCPFPGMKNGKWCHFVFNTGDAPAKLHKLSEDAGLAKDRAALSFVFASRTQASVEGETEAAGVESSPSTIVARLNTLVGRLPVRIVSDPIRLPDYHVGRYGCSRLGMVLLTGTYQAADYLETCHSGSLIEVDAPPVSNPRRDEKSGAILVPLGKPSPGKGPRR